MSEPIYEAHNYFIFAEQFKRGVGINYKIFKQTSTHIVRVAQVSDSDNKKGLELAKIELHRRADLDSKQKG